MVDAVDAVYAHLLAKGLVRRIVFGNDQKTAGVLIDTVDDARADGPANAGQLSRAMVEQRIDQRAVRVAGSRVNDHSLGLIDDKQVVVLIDDIQRDILGLGLDGLRVGQLHSVDCTGYDLFFLVDRRGVFRHTALLNEILQRTAGQCRALRGQPGIQAAGIVGRGGKFKLLHHRPPFALRAFPSCRSPAARPASAGRRPRRRRYPQS